MPSISFPRLLAVSALRCAVVSSCAVSESWPPRNLARPFIGRAHGRMGWHGQRGLFVGHGAMVRRGVRSVHAKVSRWLA